MIVESRSPVLVLFVFLRPDFLSALDWLLLRSSVKLTILAFLSFGILIFLRLRFDTSSYLRLKDIGLFFWNSLTA